MDNATEERAGVLTSVASVGALTLTEDDMEAINRYTLADLKESDVFAFTVRAATTGFNRNYTPFDEQTLKDLAELYPGTTVIKDHNHRTDNQVGRIFAAGVSEDGKELTVKAYILRTASNADMIAEIVGGIRKEVSVAFGVKEAICSICGTDNAKRWCAHWPGREYEVVEDGKRNKKTCEFQIHGARDVYELSFVAVPALKDAQTIRSAFTKQQEPEAHDTGECRHHDGTDCNMQIAIAEAFMFIEQNK